MITKNDLKTLELLSKRVMTAPTMTDDEIKKVQRLVDQGLARDFSYFHGHRMPVRLRIWGINDRGRAVLEQRTMMQQLTLPTNPKEQSRDPDST